MAPSATAVAILIVILFYCSVHAQSGVAVRPPDLVRNARNIRQMMTVPRQPGTLYSRYFLSDKLTGNKRMAAAPAMRAEKLPAELDLVLDEDESQMADLPKRFDDYGHMRFGKRGNGGAGDDTSDDYGHMRFGKRGD